jgi:hypothetical protein
MRLLTNTNLLMMFSEILALYCDNHTESVHTFIVSSYIDGLRSLTCSNSELI